MKISEELLEKIKGHGERTYPEECCGILLGKGSDTDVVVQDVIEIPNSQGDNRRRRFYVTADQYRVAERLSDERGLTLLGFYHTHPDHPAAPSAFDTEHALPWFTYVIMSIVRGHAGPVTAWLLRDDRNKFDETPFAVLAEDTRTAKENSWQ